MPAPNTKSVTIDNLITTTWYSIRKSLTDQVFQITPFFQKMYESGRIRERMPEGTHFEIPVQYAKQDQNIKWFTRGDTFGKAEKESFTNLLYYTKNLGTNVVRYWADDQKNRGKAKILDYVDSIVQNTKDSLVDKLESCSLVQDVDPNSMHALETLISTTPTTGNIAGLARSSNDYLQNNVVDFTGLTTEGSLLDKMTQSVNLCSLWKGGKRRSPDIILTTREIYQDYERIARALQTIPTSDTIRASLGFGDLSFKGIEMFWAPECPEGRMYILNTETLELAYDPDAWFEMTPWKSQVDGLERMAQIICSGNLICTNFRKNAVIHSISTVTA